IKKKRIVSELKPSKRSQHALDMCALSSKPKAVRHVKEEWSKRVWDAFFVVVVMLGGKKMQRGRGRGQVLQFYWRLVYRPL
ncbi:hypothetical protein PIIN_10632, partial [Serendipita indica DSM 11827]